MARSGAERAEEYRKRRKAAGLHGLDKEKNRKLVAARRARRKDNIVEWNSYKRREAERKREARAAAKKRPQPQSPPVPVPAYNCQQTLGKAAKKCHKALPLSPRKRIRVLEKVARKEGLHVVKRCAISLEEPVSTHDKDIVQQFFRRDDVSWQSPNIKDRVIVRRKDAKGKLIEKEHVAKRYLAMSVAEAFSLFVQEHENLKICKSKFYDLRPVEVDVFSNVPLSVCLCKTHENMRHLIDALHVHVGVARLSQGSDEFLQQVTCDPTNKLCMTGRCPACRLSFDGFNPALALLGLQKTKVRQWQEEDGRVRLVELSWTLSQCYEQARNTMEAFLTHVYIKRSQSTFFRSLRQQVDGSQIVLQIDFAENLNILTQHEVQSGHWVHERCTLFTAHAWISAVEEQPMVLISNDLVHDKVAVFKFLEVLFESLMSEHDDIRLVHIISDGAASQFKQKFTLSLMHVLEEKFGVKINWHFSASGHGKGVIDGHGATVKGAVLRRCLSGMVLQNAEAVAKLAQDICPKIDVKFVHATDIRENEPALMDHWESLKAIPRTQRMHFFESVAPYVIASKEESDNAEKNVFVLRE